MRLLQAGLVGVLIKEFRASIGITVLYIALSIGFHVWSLNVRWDNPKSYWWTNGLLAHFVLQRTSELIYQKEIRTILNSYTFISPP